MNAVRRIIAIVSLAGVALVPAVDSAAQVVRREYAIKSGVVVMLARCVTWPPLATPADGNPLTIGILGKDPFVENSVNQLERAAQQAQLKGGKIAIKRFASAKDYEPCHILFVSSLAESEGDQTPAQRVKAAQELTQGTNALVVSEGTGLALRGAAANLDYDRQSNLIRLEINPDAAARCGLKFTPDLLRLKLVQVVRDSSN